jgi:hypothetical protein
MARRERHMGSFDLSSGPPDPTMNSAAVCREWARQYQVAYPGSTKPETASDGNQDVSLLIPFQPRSGSFKEFLQGEEEAARPAREAQVREQAAREQREQVARAKRMQLESAAQQAKAAEAFRGFWATYVQSDTICQYHYDFASARGHIRDSSPYHYEIYEGYSAGLNRANRELNDPAQHALYDPSGQSWRQRQQIIDDAMKKKQAQP